MVGGQKTAHDYQVEAMAGWRADASGVGSVWAGEETSMSRQSSSLDGVKRLPGVEFRGGCDGTAERVSSRWRGGEACTAKPMAFCQVLSSCAASLTVPEDRPVPSGRFGAQFFLLEKNLEERQLAVEGKRGSQMELAEVEGRTMGVQIPTAHRHYEKDTWCDALSCVPSRYHGVPTHTTS